MADDRPQATGSGHTLPFDKLSPRDFERLCLWLVEREGYERAEHLGGAGSEQGRDVIAWRDGKLWAFQCKRVNSPVAGVPELRPGTLSAELDSENGAFTPPSGGDAPAPLHPQGQTPPKGTGLLAGVKRRLIVGEN